MKKLKIALILTLTILFNACNSDSNNDEVPNNNNSDYLYFVSGKINGEDFLYGLEAEPTSIEYLNTFGFSGTCTSDNRDYSGINYDAGVYPNLSARPAITFTFVRFYLCSNSQTQVEVFNNSFPVKSYPLAVSDDSYSGTNGSIAIAYSPNVANDTYYTSFDGNSVNGTFQITKSTEMNQYYQGQLIEVYQEIEGTFSATLYNVENPNDTVQITNGKFKLQVTIP